MSEKVGENGGAREHDSMLEEPERRRKPGWLHSAAAKLGLSAGWLLALALLLLLLLVLLIAVAVLAASSPQPPPEETSVRCETAACLRAAGQLRSGIVGGDETACNSLWEHTCSSWLERNPIPGTQSEWGVTEKILFSAERRLQGILSTLPRAESPRSYLWKLNALYLGCMDRQAHPDRSELATELLSIVNRLGGFEAVGSFERQLWNPDAVIRQLQADHNIDVFFSISVVADPDNSTTNRIQISPGGVGLPERGFYFRDPDDEVIAAYERYIQDVLLRLGATTVRAGRFARNMFHYERRLAEASLEPLQLRQTVAAPRRVTVHWLSRESPQIGWLDTLRAVYPAGEISTDTEVLLPDPQYVLELSRIVSSTADSSMNAYLMWRLISGYHPYLPDDDRVALDVLRQELSGVVGRPPQWLTCCRLTQQLFPLATGALLARQQEGRERSEQQAAALLAALKHSLGDALTYSRLVEDRSRAALLQQVSSVSLQGGYPPVLLDDKLLDKVYSEMNVMRHNFFDSVQAARRHQRVVQQKAYLAPGQEQELEPLLNGASVSYSRSRHVIVVPDQLLQPPLFDPDYPPFFQYGGLGVRLAEALLSAIEPSSQVPTSSDSNATATDETLAHNLQTFHSCVSAALARSEVREQTVERVVDSAAGQVLAVRLALQTLKAHLEEVGEEKLPGLEDMPPEKLFFVAYGQSLCKHKTREKEHWDEFSKFELDGKIKLDLTVEQAAPFRDAFHCNESHALVPKGPCGFFV